MKKLFISILAVFMMMSLSGCGNKQIFDMNRTFTKAIVEMPGGKAKEFEIQSWNDYEGEQIQITTKDGTIYLVSSYNCILVSD